MARPIHGVASRRLGHEVQRLAAFVAIVAGFAPAVARAQDRSWMLGPFTKPVAANSR